MAPLPRALLAGFLFLVPICTFAGCSLLNLPAAIQGGYSVHEASYGTGPLDKLDIYIPRVSRKDKHDVIVFYYSGRWRYGKKENSRFVGAALARRGYVTVIPEFRKYPSSRLVDQLASRVVDGRRSSGSWSPRAFELGTLEFRVSVSESVAANRFLKGKGIRRKSAAYFWV